MKNRLNTRKIPATITILLALTFLTGSATAFAGGDGSSSNPYQISTCSELNSVGSDNYILINDIDCSGYSWSQTNTLEGSIDGQGYTVSNLDMTGSFYSGESTGFTVENIIFESSSVTNANAFFGTTSFNHGSTIRNVEFNGITLTDSNGDTDGFTVTNLGNGALYRDITLDNVDVEVDGVLYAFGEYNGNTVQDIEDISVLNSNFTATGNAALFDIEGSSLYDSVIRNVNFYTGATSEAYSTHAIIWGGSVYNTAVEDFSMNNQNGGGQTHLFFLGSTVDNVYADNVDFTGAGANDGLITSMSTTTNSYYADVVNEGGSSLFSSTPSTTSDNYYDTENTPFTTTSAATPLTTNEMQGASAETNMAFDFQNVWATVTNPDDYPILQTNIVPPPTIDAVNSPTDGSSYLQNQETVTFSSDISTSNDESATANYIVEDPSGTNTTVYSESISAGSSTTVSYSQSFNDTGNYQWYINLETASKSVTEPATSFNIEQYIEPEVDLWLPENDSIVELQWNEDGLYEVEYRFNVTLDDSVNSADYSLNTAHGNFCADTSGAGTGSRDGSVSSSGTYSHYCQLDPDFTETWSIDLSDPYKSVSSNEFTFQTELVDVPPQINNFEVNPAIENISVGESFDFALDGSVGDDPIQSITYSMDVSDATNPSDVTITDIDFQNADSFNDQANNVFEYKDAYQGSQITITATVEDEAGRTDQVSQQKFTSVPPNSLSLFNPNDGEAILIPEGETSTDVTLEYGAETDIHGGTLELLLNGNPVQSVELNASTTYNSITYTDSFTESSNTWSLRFTDSVTGEVYTSNTYNFEVTDTPFSLTLDNPEDGNEFKLLDTSSTSVSHDFTINAEATNDEFYYEFTLTNSSSGATLESRTSQNLDIGIQSFSEQVQSLGDGSYEWTVDLYMAADDSLQESKTSSYTIVESPEFESSITNPPDGETYTIPSDATSTDVNTSYSVQTFNEEVTLEFLYDGTIQDERTVSPESSVNPEFALNQVSEGSHSVTLNAVDESGRTQNITNTFEVQSEDEANITLTELSTDPSIDNLKPSDESFDVYFEADNKTAVEYVEIDVLVNGTQEHTITVPEDELLIGSIGLLETVDLQRDLGYNYNQLINSDISIRATVVDAAQRTYRFTRSFAFGINDPVPRLTSPVDGKTWNETSGQPKEHRLAYEIDMANEHVNYQVWINDSQIDFGQATNTGETFQGETFANVVEDLAYNQFGEFKWKVNITEEVTGYETSTGWRTFNIVNASETDVILDFNSPEKNDVFKVQNLETKTTVPFGYRYQSDVDGTITIDLEGEKNTRIYSEQVSAGEDTEVIPKTLPVGSYEATLTFEKEGGGEVTRTRFFTIRKKNQLPEDRVAVDKPEAGDRIYQGEKTEFVWYVNSTGGNGDTWYEIRNDAGNTVENYTEEYEEYNELQGYGRKIGSTQLPVGEYTAQAFFQRDGDTTQNSSEVPFTVVDFSRPKLQNIESPENNTVVQENSPINFSTTVEAFDSPATATIKYSEVEEYESFDIASADLNAFETTTLEGVKRLDAGEYVWYVQFDVNPSFTTDYNYLTVESTDIQEPDFSLNNPDQNQTIEIPSGQENVSVSFDYDTTVYSQSETDVELLLSNREDGLTDFKVQNTHTQVAEDGTVNTVFDKDLQEDGYLYKVRVQYPNGSITSDSVGFAVNDPETEETPEPPQPEEGEEQSNFLSQIIEYVAGFLGIGFGGLGGTVQIVLASLLTVLVGGIVNNWTESAEIGLMSMMVSIFIFVATGWLPAWIGIILFMLSAAIFIYALRRVHGGR